MINKLVKQAHDNAKAKGWHDAPRTFGEEIALIHSEVSEALEDYRAGRAIVEVWYEYESNNDVFTSRVYRDKEFISEEWKPCGIPSELADICIRVFDMCGKYGIDLEQAIAEKMAYNATRSHKHGGKVI